MATECSFLLRVRTRVLGFFILLLFFCGGGVKYFGNTWMRELFMVFCAV